MLLSLLFYLEVEMASIPEICNLAISHLGSSKEIANLDTEKSSEAAACRRFYETCRKTVLTAARWPFATKFITMALIETDPTAEWGFAYRYPSDCLQIRRLGSGIRIDTHNSRVPYKIIYDDLGAIVLTDSDDPFIEYTYDAKDPSKYPEDFTLAFSLRLAAYIAPRITGGDPFGLRKESMSLYQIELSKAMANAYNEEQSDLLPESEFITARE